MPDDHSDVVPLLPIPNRTVKRVSADDSADSRVKVGHCQAITASESPTRKSWAFCFANHILSNFKPSIRATFLLTSSDTKSSIHILIETEEKKV
ncbi:MAG: hypothetical protein RLZ89_432 [Pseudomonadota bacterium]